MTTSVDDALRDEERRTHPYPEDVKCLDCGEGFVVDFIDGEPVDEKSMACHCGGELVVE
jgi:hypothetical protein